MLRICYEFFLDSYDQELISSWYDPLTHVLQGSLAGNNALTETTTENMILPLYYINGLVQDRSISIANALEIVQPCTKRSRCRRNKTESKFWNWPKKNTFLRYISDLIEYQLQLLSIWENLTRKTETVLRIGLHM